MGSQFQPYVAGPADASGLRLHLNEFRGAHHASVVQSVRDAVCESSVGQYTTSPPPKFIAELARFLGVPPECIAVAAGSDEVLRAAVDTCAIRGQDSVVVGVPGYTHFTHYARLRGLAVHEYALGLDPGTASSPGLLKPYGAVLAKGALVYLGSPNNPVGDVWDREDVAALAAAYPRSTFLVDEAYIEYVGANCELALEDAVGFSSHILNAGSLAALAAEAPNVIVSRTFSKAFGLASLRIGYAIAVPALVGALSVALNPKAVCAFSYAGAMAVLTTALGHYLVEAMRVSDSKAAMVSRLTAAGWWVVPSPANFILVYVGDDAKLLVAELEADRIHIRDRSDLPCLAGFVRVTAGTRDDCDRVCGAFLARAPPPERGLQIHYTPKTFIAELKVLYLAAMAVFRTAGTNVWLCAGSLLGCVRHGGIIPWDDDIDLAYAISFPGRDPLEGLVNAFLRAGLSLQRNRTNAYWQIGTNPPGCAISPCHIDVFPFLRRGDEYVNADARFCLEDPLNRDAHCNIRMKAAELFPLERATFCGESALVPRASGQILARALGPDFMSVARVRSGSRAPIRDYFPA